MESRGWWRFLVLLIFVNVTHGNVNDFHLPSPDVMKRAVEGLIGRLLHHRGKEFIVEIAEMKEGRDYFKVSAEGVEGRPVKVCSGTGVGAALGVMTYLKYFCHASVSWEADHLSTLPDIWPKGSIESNLLDKYRYSGNPCVFSYSYPFWSWPRWEREIDLMALMGINLVLALNGQEALWRRMYMEMGLTEKELEDHFAGYAFLAWNRMGNIKKWGGPLSLHWQEEKLKIQKRIITRMREFGMFAVLPAFSGHVPEGILRVFPMANITKLPAWGHFSELYTRTYMLDPEDPLFEKIGVAFIKKVILEFGSDHFYLADPFNEMIPASSDLTYLGSVSRSIYRTLTKGDSEAIWVTQGWMFFSDSDFWKEPQAKSYLTSVPQGRMLILDLTAENFPQYGRLQSFFGQPFIFCLLNNYGEVRGIFGNVDVLLKNLEDARQYPNSSMVGIGMTPEGIGSNYILFDLLFEMSWKSHINDVQDWAVQYSRRRYGVQNKDLEDAWKLLMGSIYNSSLPIRYHGRYIPLMNRPRLNPKFMIWYDLKDVVKAWDLIIYAATENLEEVNNKNSRMENMILKPVKAKIEVLPLTKGNIVNSYKSDEAERKIIEGQEYRGQKKEVGRTTTININPTNDLQVHLVEGETYKYDVVEVTRELLQIAAVDIIKTLVRNYRKRNVTGIVCMNDQLQELISDLNLLLGSNSAYLLGSWVQEATEWSNETQERSLLRKNSLYQISLWGPNGEILDYAVKQWNGVMQKYVAPRWYAFAEALLAAAETGEVFDKAKFQSDVFENVEKPFAEDLETSYPSVPVGEAVKLAIRMHKKYRRLFTKKKQKQYMKLLLKPRKTKRRSRNSVA